MNTLLALRATQSLSPIEAGRLAACAALAGAPAGLGALIGAPSLPWGLSGGGAVLLGLGAIRLTRGRWLSAPFLMLLLCTAGMAVGLMIDRQWVGPEVLANLCFAAPRSFAASLLRHGEVLRATNVAMLLGGMATIAVVEWRARGTLAMRCRKAVCGRAGFNLVCNSTMLSGMLLGGWLGPSIGLRLDLGWGASAMVAVMVVGMVWGMAASMLLYRSLFALLDRHRAL